MIFIKFSSYQNLTFPFPMAENSRKTVSDTELLQQLETLSQSLFKSKNNRRASPILDRFSVRAINESSAVIDNNARFDRGSQSLRQVKNHVPFESLTPKEKKNKGLWSWRPLRALSHIRMQRVGCLFHVKVLNIQNLPASTNGLRLYVSLRKMETKEGAVCTMPARVIHGSAEFEETLFVNCNLYCKGKSPEFQSRLFLISVFEVDAPEFDIGVGTVDLSSLVKESIERSFEGGRVREWDMKFRLTGKAKGGELLLKLGFQIMEEGGVSIYSQSKGKGLSPPPLGSMRAPSLEKFNDFTFPRVEIVDMGIRKVEKIKESREVVKEVIHQRIMELESIANEIKALESTMSKVERNEAQELDANEETVTRKYLQMLELGDDEEPNKQNLKKSLEIEAITEMVFVPDLGKGLGPVVQTRDGGYLVSTNIFNTEVKREEIPKLTMQISRPFILDNQQQDSVLELFQKLAATDPQELISNLSSLMAMDELMGKTADQEAFEGIASAIINGRNKDNASFSASKSIDATKSMAKAMIKGNINEDSMTLDEILAFSIQKIEAMVGEGLKIQAEMAQEEAPYEISNSINEEETKNLLDSAILLEEWERNCDSNCSIKLIAMIQPRDPVRRYEPVGGLLIAFVEGMKIENDTEEQERFKVIGVHVGGMKLRSREGQRARLSAMQWLVGIGRLKLGKNKKIMEAKLEKDMIWSLSSRLMGDMWVKPMRNPNVKFL